MESVSHQNIVTRKELDLRKARIRTESRQDNIPSQAANIPVPLITQIIKFIIGEKTAKHVLELQDIEKDNARERKSTVENQNGKRTTSEELSDNRSKREKLTKETNKRAFTEKAPTYPYKKMKLT